MSGFIKKSQKSILEKYADLYFEEARMICDKFDFEYALDFCTLLFPSFKSFEFLKEKVGTLLPCINPENIQLINIFKNKLDIKERNDRIKKKNQ